MLAAAVFVDLSGAQAGKRFPRCAHRLLGLPNVRNADLCEEIGTVVRAAPPPLCDDRGGNGDRDLASNKVLVDMPRALLVTFERDEHPGVVRGSLPHADFRAVRGRLVLRLACRQPSSSSASSSARFSAVRVDPPRRASIRSSAARRSDWRPISATSSDMLPPCSSLARARSARLSSASMATLKVSFFFIAFIVAMNRSNSASERQDLRERSRCRRCCGNCSPRPSASARRVATTPRRAR